MRFPKNMTASLKACFVMRYVTINHREVLLKSKRRATSCQRGVYAGRADRASGWSTFSQVFQGSGRRIFFHRGNAAFHRTS
jgi:hypothetical protein